MIANQSELFDEEKIFHGANAVKLPYWERDGKLIRFALSDKLILDVTHQKGGHIYSNVPGHGRLEKRGKNAKINFLSTAALLRRSLELAESISRHGRSIAQEAEEQGKLLRAASEIRPVPPAYERSVNKLASRAAANTGDSLRFFNPKALLSIWLFSPVPTWLRAVPGITAAEQLVYAAMVFRADDDGIFRRSLLGLSELIRLSGRGIQKAAKSLENRRVIFKATENSDSRIPNEYKFLWLAIFEATSHANEQRSLAFPEASEQKSDQLANAVTQPREQRALHNNQELLQKKHAHDHAHAPVGLTPEQEDLINQINELTEIENRTEHFRTLWEMCVKEDQLAVFQAIGETRCMKREGKIKRTVGGTLYWHYKNFHKHRARVGGDPRELVRESHRGQ